MKYAIEIDKLEKNYGDFCLRIDKLNIATGSIVGLIGENGAGKTTLIKTMLDVVKKDRGKIKILGKSSAFEEEIGVVLDNSFFPEILNPKNIDSVLKDIYKKWDADLFYRYLQDFGIKDSQPLKTMSKGMRKKVEIAAALAHHPKLLILDEATSGLDPIVRSEVLDIFLEFIQDEEHTVILSTHITSDLEHIADHIVFIDDGHIALDKNRDDIFDYYGILKCENVRFKEIEREDIVSFKKNRYGCEVLVSDKRRCAQKYSDFIIDKISLEDLMLFIIKGERQNVWND